MIRNIPRLAGWYFAVIALLLIVHFVAPANIDVVVYKIALACLGGLFGYILDRSLFPYARPHDAPAVTQARAVGISRQHSAEAAVDARQNGTDLYAIGCMLRRAIIVGSALLAVTLGI